MRRERRCFNALKWFINARYAAVLGVVLALALAALAVQMPPRWSLSLPILGALALANLIFDLIWHREAKNTEGTSRTLNLKLSRAQMAVDLLALTALLHLYGGATNPFFLLFFLHIIISCFFEQRDRAMLVMFSAVSLYLLLVWTEHFGLLPHHPVPGLHAHSPLESPIWAAGASVAFVSGAVVIWFLVSFMAGQLRRREDRLEMLTSQLAATNDELRRNQELKEGFFRTVAHEMKRPVTATIQLLDAVKEVYGTQLDPKALDLVCRAQTRAHSSFSLIKDLIQLARLEAPALADPKAKPGTFASLCPLLDEFRTSAQANQIILDVQLHCETDPLAIAESDLHLVASNLVSNAIRYSKKGGSVAVRSGQEAGKYIFSVADQGIGIAPEDQKRLFQEFFRSTEAKRHSGDGSGLGLAIVKRLVDRAGGTITCQSRPNEGTTFTVTLQPATPPRPHHQ